MQGINIGLIGFEDTKAQQLLNQIETLDLKDLTVSRVKGQEKSRERTAFALDRHYDLIFLNSESFKNSLSSVVKRIKNENVWCEVVVIATEQDYEIAVSCLRAGVKDLLLTPINDKDLAQIAQRCYTARNLRTTENFHLSALNFANQISEFATGSHAAGFFQKCASRLASDFFVEDLFIYSRNEVDQKTELLWGDHTSIDDKEFSQNLEKFAFAELGESTFDGIYHREHGDKIEIGLWKKDFETDNDLRVILSISLKKLSMSYLDSLFMVIGFIFNAYQFSLTSSENTKLISLANTDDVTGMFNQRKLYADLHGLVKDYEKNQTPFSVIFLDVDRFKSVNDGHGHLVGSRILVRLAAILKETVRDSDLIYRYGGDEFVVIFPETQTDIALKVSDRILNNVKAYNFKDIGQKTFKISVSIGVASFPEHAESIDEIIDLADKMMYKAKAAGRGRVCLADKLFDKANS